MNASLREDIATLGTNLVALLVAVGAVVGAIHYGPVKTLALGGVLIAAYTGAWLMLRLTTRGLRTTNDDSGE